MCHYQNSKPSSLLIHKTREVKTPTRANKHDAGIDFFLPTVNETLREDIIAKNREHLSTNDFLVMFATEGQLVVLPHTRVLIPSGIKVCILEKDTCLIAANKSGLASKHGIVFRAQVVDADYTGEVHISIENTGNTPVIFESGDKIQQFIHTPIILSVIKEIDSEDYKIYTSNSDRGEGGFGSSGRK